MSQLQTIVDILREVPNDQACREYSLLMLQLGVPTWMEYSEPVVSLPLTLKETK